MALKTKIGKLDKAFSLLIRTRDNYTCRRCGRSKPDVRIECSHTFSRRHRSTRWDTGNALALCFSCHRWWHENPVDAVEWMRKRMGADALRALRKKAMTPRKFTPADREELYEDLKRRLKELE